MANERFPSSPAGVRAWLEARGVAVKGVRASGDNTLLLLEHCPINPEIISTGSSDIAVIVGKDGKLGYANKHNRGQDYTWRDLRRAIDPEYVDRESLDSDVDISCILNGEPRATGTSASPRLKATHAASPDDPGLLPESLLSVPGFIDGVIESSLCCAPYPSRTMAFAGALSLQAFLAGRKVSDSGDNRTNLYVLALAHSSAGKDMPRKMNAAILHAIGLSGCLAQQFASGEGIQDALASTPSMLVQTDEIDTLLQSINHARDARFESMMSALLTMYSAVNSVYPRDY